MISKYANTIFSVILVTFLLSHQVENLSYSFSYFDLDLLGNNFVTAVFAISRNSGGVHNISISSEFEPMLNYFETKMSKYFQNLQEHFN
ncbi:hypothetical protein ABEB36_013053 [Hypothenemus hampei]|uniref:Uncharacterized protein n=1 Tax=Hypothenemus hampei TaxID=57062 RepID=A0ABD1E9D3_HYPHA